MFTLRGSVRSLLLAVVAAATGNTFDLSAAGSVRVPSADNAASAVPKSYVDAAVAAVSSGFVLKGTARIAVVAADLAAIGGTYDAGAKTITLGAGALPTIDGVSDLAEGQLAFFAFSSSNKARNGLYEYTTAGDTGVSAVFTRSDLADEGAEFPTGAMFAIREGTSYGGRFAYVTNLSAITLDTTAIDILFSAGGGASYTNGNGLSLSGTTFAVQAKSGGVVVVDGDGVDVQAASGSQAGTMSSADYTKLGRLADAVARGQGNTTNAGTYSLSLPTLGADRVQRLKVEITSQSLTDTAECKVATVLLGARRGSSGNSEIIGPATNPERGVEIENLDDAGALADVLVEYIVGTNGADSIRVTGVNSHNIDHDVTASIRYLG